MMNYENPDSPTENLQGDEAVKSEDVVATEAPDTAPPEVENESDEEVDTDSEGEELVEEVDVPEGSVLKINGQKYTYTEEAGYRRV